MDLRRNTYIIAEAGVNHNGSLDMAIQLVDEAAKAGADAVKFQTFRAELLVTPQAAMADYQIQNTGLAETQYQMLKKLELNESDYRNLIKHCSDKKIDFISTPFDMESADLLIDDFKLNVIKISSGDITNAPLLLRIANAGKQVILSTGMSILSDVEAALAVLAYGYSQKGLPKTIKDVDAAYSSLEGQTHLAEHVRLLHCTTEYPAPLHEVNLRAMDTLRSAFGLDVGYSDHTEGIFMAIAAVARGASIIEKHLTLDQTLPGPDHIASLEPADFALMVKYIRDTELALGKPAKIVTPSEQKNKYIARKSIVAARKITKGETFTPENLITKRPGEGVSPIYYWDYLGQPADRDYEQDELIGL